MKNSVRMCFRDAAFSVYVEVVFVSLIFLMLPKSFFFVNQFLWHLPARL